MEYKHEIELKINFKSNKEDFEDDLSKFRDIFMESFDEKIQAEQILAVCKLLKFNGEYIGM